MVKYWTTDPNDRDHGPYNSPDEAVKMLQELLNEYRRYANEGWPDSFPHVVIDDGSLEHKFEMPEYAICEQFNLQYREDADEDEWFDSSFDSVCEYRVKVLAGNAKPPLTEEDFKSALYDAFMEGRVHAHWELNRDDAPTPSDFFEQLYSGDKQGWGPAIVKFRNQFTATQEGE